MALPIVFEKGRAEYLLECIEHGKPIQSLNGQWTLNDCLALAGACFFMAISHGPATRDGQRLDWTNISAEKREALWDGHFHDLHAAIQLYGNLTQKVKDNEYDNEYAPLFKAALQTTGSNTVKLFPIEGKKNLEKEGGDSPELTH